MKAVLVSGTSIEFKVDKELIKDSTPNFEKFHFKNGIADFLDNNSDDEDVDNDGEPDDVTVTIIPNVLAEEDIVIYNVMTPNGDGLNDIFMIENID